ncbi:MAG: tyrosine--tRNA ligase [Candidatus Omnitrophica bacterium]|nr:tyrosine--tRNA ligase [Candidatus Omnitrophota bacterium]
MNKGLVQKQLAAFREHAVEVLPEEALTEKITKAVREEKPLKLKIGLDPTASDIHFGHTVVLRKLRKLQDFGHQVYLIIGDFTARVGDPSGRTQLRPVLSEEEIRRNAETYTSQAFKVLDRNRTCVRWNSEWFSSMLLSDFFPLLGVSTVARMLERDDFAQRMDQKKPLSLSELVYPLIQGYDSVKIQADVEFGGTDQTFNLFMGRQMQEYFGQVPQAVITMPLLVGLDGKNKMSKSLDNYIGITEEPGTMFGKTMSVSDEVMEEYARLLTDFPEEELRSMHPKEAKLALAGKLVAQYHSDAEAAAARKEFERVFSARGLPQDIPVYESGARRVDLIEALSLSGTVPSKNEARRLFAQKSVSLLAGDAAVTLEDPVQELPPEGVTLKIGKKRFLRIVPK